MTVRVRGIYTTALTALLDDVVQASSTIEERFEESFPLEPAAATVETTADRQGVHVTGSPERVADVIETLLDLGRDTFVWRAPLSRGAVFAGEVVETLGSGALVECGVATSGADTLDGSTVASGTRGFLPYSKTARHIDVGDRLRVQVDELQPPWSGGRPVLETDVRVHGELASLIRGRTDTGQQPELADILPVDPPQGWGVEWSAEADDASISSLTACLQSLSRRAEALDDALAEVSPPTEVAPECYWPGEDTCWVWFGRESRFALDAVRREVVPTMAGHHRIKAATAKAGTAVDFVEGICGNAGTGDEDFPFDVVTDQFGPGEGDSVRIDHGKPDGSLFSLGEGVVTDRDPSGQITVEREMSPGGTYDGLGVERQEGDVAITKLREGRWWYPTVYRGEEGETRGTYVNVCTPVEIFPNVARYVDLYVDVVRHADGTVERVDDDELDEAVEAGEVSPALAENARAVADAISKAL